MKYLMCVDDKIDILRKIRSEMESEGVPSAGLRLVDKHSRFPWHVFSRSSHIRTNCRRDTDTAVAKPGVDYLKLFLVFAMSVTAIVVYLGLVDIIDLFTATALVYGAYLSYDVRRAARSCRRAKATANHYLMIDIDKTHEKLVSKIIKSHPEVEAIKA